MNLRGFLPIIALLVVCFAAVFIAPLTNGEKVVAASVLVALVMVAVIWASCLASSKGGEAEQDPATVNASQAFAMYVKVVPHTRASQEDFARFWSILTTDERLLCVCLLHDRNAGQITEALDIGRDSCMSGAPLDPLTQADIKTALARSVATP